MQSLKIILLIYVILLVRKRKIRRSKGTKDDDQSKIHSVGNQNDT